MKFEISWDEKAFSELNELEATTARRIAKKVKELSDRPFRGIKKIKGESVYRLRVGDYRILFIIQENKIFILRVGHRKSIYKK